MFPEANGVWRAVLAKVVEPADYFVRAYRARSTKYHIGVITVPLIESARLRIVPPAYANRAAYEGPMPKEGVSGLPRHQGRGLPPQQPAAARRARIAPAVGAAASPPPSADEARRARRPGGRRPVLDRRRREVRVPGDRRGRPDLAAVVLGQHRHAGRRAAVHPDHAAAEDVAGHAHRGVAGDALGRGRLRDFAAATVPQPERLPPAAGRSAAAAAAAAPPGRVGPPAAGAVRPGAGRRRSSSSAASKTTIRPAPRGPKAPWSRCGSSARRSSSGWSARGKASRPCSRNTTRRGGGWKRWPRGRGPAEEAEEAAARRQGCPRRPAGSCERLQRSMRQRSRGDSQVGQAHRCPTISTRTSRRS